MPILIFPKDRPGDAFYASLVAQCEVEPVQVIQDRRGEDRRKRGAQRVETPAEGQLTRKQQRRQINPMTVPLRVFPTPWSQYK